MARNDVQKQLKRACELARKHGAENVTVLVNMVGGQGTNAIGFLTTAQDWATYDQFTSRSRGLLAATKTAFDLGRQIRADRPRPSAATCVLRRLRSLAPRKARMPGVVEPENSSRPATQAG